MHDIDAELARWRELEARLLACRHHMTAQERLVERMRSERGFDAASLRLAMEVFDTLRDTAAVLEGRLANLLRDLEEHGQAPSDDFNA